MQNQIKIDRIQLPMLILTLTDLKCNGPNKLSPIHLHLHERSEGMPP